VTDLRPSSAPPTADLLVVCTGNAVRSVIAAALLGRLAEEAGVPLRIATAGTHALDGQPVSMRTRAALALVDPTGAVTVSRHRSRHLDPADLARADLVIGMEADHVRYIRRHHGDAAGRTTTMRAICRSLSPGPADLRMRIAALELATVELSDDQDVADPAGRDDRAYADCARELLDLCTELVGRL
jgi:protein-tyrosine-phosphatase